MGQVYGKPLERVVGIFSEKQAFILVMVLRSSFGFTLVMGKDLGKIFFLDQSLWQSVKNLWLQSTGKRY